MHVCIFPIFSRFHCQYSCFCPSHTCIPFFINAFHTNAPKLQQSWLHGGREREREREASSHGRHREIPAFGLLRDGSENLRKSQGPVNKTKQNILFSLNYLPLVPCRLWFSARAGVAWGLPVPLAAEAYFTATLAIHLLNRSLGLVGAYCYSRKEIQQNFIDKGHAIRC